MKLIFAIILFILVSIMSLNYYEIKILQNRVCNTGEGNDLEEIGLKLKKYTSIIKKCGISFGIVVVIILICLLL